MPKSKPFPAIALRDSLSSADIEKARDLVYSLINYLPDSPLAAGIGRRNANRVNTLLGKLLGILQERS